MNSLLVSLCACGGLELDKYLARLYVGGDPERNLMHWFIVSVLTHGLGQDWGPLAWATIKAATWYSKTLEEEHAQVTLCNAVRCIHFAHASLPLVASLSLSCRLVFSVVLAHYNIFWKL